MTLPDDLRAATTKAEMLLAELAVSDQALNDALAAEAAKDAEIADLTKQLADCKNPPPPPPPQTTRFGACPIKGGNIAGVVSKWGNGVAIRSFVSGGFITVTVPASAGPIHQSWKPPIGSPINGANVAAACAYFRAGDYVEIWHEADVKFRSGSFTASQVQQVIDMKNWFYDVVHSVRPDLLVPATFGAWMFDDRSGQYPGTLTDPSTAEFYSKIKADIIGVDCDGYTSSTQYPDFTSVVRNVKEFVAKHGYKGWSVPEFIHPRLSGDANGNGRAAWLTKWSQAFKDGGAGYVTAYDYNYRPNEEITPGSPEFAAYKAFI